MLNIQIRHRRPPLSLYSNNVTTPSRSTDFHPCPPLLFWFETAPSVRHPTNRSLLAPAFEPLAMTDKTYALEKCSAFMRSVAMRIPAEDLPSVQDALRNTGLSRDQHSVFDGLITNRLNEEYAPLMTPIYTP